MTSDFLTKVTKCYNTRSMESDRVTLVQGYQSLLSYPENGGNRIPRKVGAYLPKFKVSYLRRHPLQPALTCVNSGFRRGVNEIYALGGFLRSVEL
jgi:hypothetical protein